MDKDYRIRIVIEESIGTWKDWFLAHFVPGMLLSPLRLITYIYPLLLEYNDT
jgi:hypothetical protein